MENKRIFYPPPSHFQPFGLKFGVVSRISRFASLIFLALFFAPKMEAQPFSDPVIPLDCNELQVQLCIPNPTGSICENCSSSSKDCRQVVFSVFLQTNNPVIGGNPGFYLDYTELSIQIKVQATGNFLSKINETATRLCLGNPEFGATIERFEVDTTIDIDGFQTVMLYLNANSLGEPGMPPPPPAEVHFPDGEKCHLFNLVVDAWLGEEIKVKTGDLYYYKEDFHNPACSVNDPDPFSQNTWNTGGNAQDSAEPIANISSNFCLNFSVDNNLKTAAVTLSQSGILANTQLDCLDFVVDVEMQDLMEDPEDINYNPLVSPFVTRKFWRQISPTHYQFYLRLENFPVKTGVSLVSLFEIQVKPPIFASQGGMATLTFGGGRVKGVVNSTMNCANLHGCGPNDIGIINFPGFTVCDPQSYSLSINGDDNGTPCQIRITVTLDWNDPNPVVLHHFRLEMDVEKDADVTFSHFDTDEAFGTMAGVQNGQVSPCGTVGSPSVFTFLNNKVVVCFDNYAFPNEMLTWQPQASFGLVFNAPSGCINDVTIRRAEVGRYTSPFMATCIPHFEVVDFPLCPPLIRGTVKDQFEVNIEPGEIFLDDAPPLGTLGGSITAGNFSVCVSQFDHTYRLYPFKDINPLNGVSTFDLVNMSKHILQVTKFTEGWQWVAADINNNKQVTTFDIVELRKLILGVYTDFPANDSWRFYPEGQIFDLSNNNNPLDDNPSIPAYIDVFVSSNGPTPEAHFTGVKIGDVNGDHIANNRPANQPPTGAYSFISNVELTPVDQFLTIPIICESEEPLIALQTGFRFDPEKMEFIGASQGNVKGILPSCFNLNEASNGRLKLVWLSEDMETEWLMPGQTLCNFTFKLKTALAADDILLQADDSILSGEGFTADEKRYSLKLESRLETGSRFDSKATANTQTLQVNCVPNPVSGLAKFIIQGKETGISRLSVYGPFGIRMWYRELHLQSGREELEIPEVANWPTGVYTWHLLTDSDLLLKGRIVKQ